MAEIEGPRPETDTYITRHTYVVGHGLGCLTMQGQAISRQPGYRLCHSLRDARTRFGGQ